MILEFEVEIRKLFEEVKALAVAANSSMAYGLLIV